MQLQSASTAFPAMTLHPLAEPFERFHAWLKEAEAKEPNMDELVARVLEKMNPEVMQKVTREILKPVIEAIIQNELTKKS